MMRAKLCINYAIGFIQSWARNACGRRTRLDLLAANYKRPSAVRVRAPPLDCNALHLCAHTTPHINAAHILWGDLDTQPHMN